MVALAKKAQGGDTKSHREGGHTNAQEGRTQKRKEGEGHGKVQGGTTKRTEGEGHRKVKGRTQKRTRGGDKEMHYFLDTETYRRTEVHVQKITLSQLYRGGAHLKTPTFCNIYMKKLLMTPQLNSKTDPKPEMLPAV